MAAKIVTGDARELVHTIQTPVNCICTDPPYGMGFQSGSAQTAAGKKWVKKIEGDADLDAAIPLFLDVMNPLVAKTADEAEMYVFTRWSILGVWIEVVNELEGFDVQNTLVWDKGTPGMGDIDGGWANSHELIIYAKKGRRPRSGRRRSSIIAVDRIPSNQHIHPTQKPVGLIEHLIRASTDMGDFVVDPFCGSGSTVIAANRMGRHALGFEVDPEHAERARLRLSQGVFDI